jgi:hypothetical protein
MTLIPAVLSSSVNAGGQGDSGSEFEAIAQLYVADYPPAPVAHSRYQSWPRPAHLPRPMARADQLLLSAA